MLKTDSGLTTEVPLWLIVSAIIALVARTGLFFYEHEHPPVASEEIHWQLVTKENSKPADTKSDTKSDGKESANENGKENAIEIATGDSAITGKPPGRDGASKGASKLTLYYFTANWSGSVRKLENNAFSNKNIVEYVNANFIPKKVVDLSVEEHISAPYIQKLEDKYGLSTIKVFPKLIVALPDGTEVQRSIGARTAPIMDKFLRDAVKSECYVRAKQQLKAENFEQTARLMGQYLENCGLKNERSLYALIREYSCLRLIGKNKQAEDLIQADIGKVEKNWPYPVLKYLAHEIDEQKLLQETGDKQAMRMEMHCYVGVALYADGDMVKGEEHLKQCVSDPVFKEWPEFQLAQSILKRIEKSDTGKGVEAEKPTGVEKEPPLGAKSTGK